MQGTEMISTQKITVRLVIEDLERNSQIRLQNAVYCRNDIPSRRQDSSTWKAERWQHLAKLAT